MDLEQRLHASLVAPDPGAEFTAAVMARMKQHASAGRHGVAATVAAKARSRWLSRLLSVGIVTAVGIAAAMVAERLARAPERPVAATVSAPDSTAVANTRTAAGASVEVQPAGPGVAMTQPAGAPASSASSSGSLQPADAAARFIVLLKPLRQEGGDATVQGLVESFHAAVMQELRNVPGLILLVEDDAVAEQRAEYILTMTSVAPLQPGVATIQVQASTSLRSRSRSPMSMATRTNLAEGAPGSSVSESAVDLVKMLRVQVFPPETSMQQQLVAQIRDGSLPQGERRNSLSSLLFSLRSNRGAGLDTGNISAIVEFTATLPADQRAEVWRQLRIIPRPELVAPLLDALRRDPDEPVRIEVLTTLAATQGSVPEVRAALEAIAREDSQPGVRMSAQRALGQTQWRGPVIAALKDTSLPYAERLAPLLLAARSGSTPAAAASLNTFMQDREVVNLLVGLVRDGRSNVAQADTTKGALNLLARVDDPAVFDLFMQVLQDRAQPAESSLVMSAMPWLMSHRNDARVSKAIEELSTDNSNPAVSEQIREFMRVLPARQ